MNMNTTKNKVAVLVAALLMTVAAVAACDSADEPVTTEGTDTQATETTQAVEDTVAVTDADTVATEESQTESPTEIPTETPTETPTEPETEAPIVFNEMNDLQKLTTPFWRMDTMYRESTCMIVREDGSITAKLAFKPTRIIAVENNALTVTFEEGKDYTWDGETNSIVWVDGSSIPFFTQNDIQGRREDGTQLEVYPTWDEMGRSRFGNALYCVSEFLYSRQIAVTYEYEYGSWDGYVAPYQGETIPKTMAKLKAGEETTVFFYGDSIFTGCDSSSMYNREPNQQSFPTLTKQVLEATYGGRVKVYNPSVGGMNSVWGKDNAKELVCDRAQPDLVIIGFGMNDGDKQGRNTARNIEMIIKNIREVYPDCEFMVVACMVPNAEGGFLTTQNQLPEAYANLAEKLEGVAFVDMFTPHEKLLEEKDFISMSGNNINHPNDWLIRVYAMQILSALVEY